MAAKKKAVSNKKKVTTPIKERVVTSEVTTGNRGSNRFNLSTLTSYRPSKKGWIVIAAAAVLILLATQKGLFLAASVNGTPITNIELLSRLNQQYRAQMVSQLVDEKLILNEAQKNGVSVSAQEVNDKISQIEGNVGGPEALDNLLAQQDQTRSGLKDQLKIQLIIEKLYANEATVSAEEVSQFISENADSLQATTSAEQTKEATDILKRQKLGKAFNEKFQEIKNSAKIQTY